MSRCAVGREWCIGQEREFETLSLSLVYLCVQANVYVYVYV
jgi:hypothetical protein